MLPQQLPSSVRLPNEPCFPIDVVYTWVDDRDPVWRAHYAHTLGACERGFLNGHATSPARFRNRDELRFSLRSLALHAGFVRHVYVVTAGQAPAWLTRDAPHVHVVPHEDILPSECLPTFNSHAIETGLHRIDGLAEHYLYLNDDFFFGRDCQPSTFFTPDGRPKVFPDERARVPPGAPSPSDKPVNSASKNSRDLLRAEFDVAIEHKMRHAPYPQRRSILAEMEECFPLAFKQTARNPFRHYTDVNVASCLSHHFALSVGAAVPGDVPSAYIDIAKPWAMLQMRRLLQRRDRDVFCLNDSEMRLLRRAIVDATARTFLNAYFPDPGPFERPQ